MALPSGRRVVNQPHQCQIMVASNNTQITPPRVSLIDERTGAVSREWYRWFYNIFTITGGGLGITPVINGGTGLATIPTDGQLLIGNGTGYTLNTLGTGAGISVTNAAGTITIANTGVLSWSGGTTGLTPATATNGNVMLAGTLIAANGGTGFASYAVGDLLYANTTTTLAKLPDVATGNALISGGVGTAPAWGKIGLTTHVSGTLPIANGGTNGTATPTAGAVPSGTGTSYGFTAAGTAGQVLTSAGAGIPTWTTPTTGTVTSVTGTAPVVSSGGATPAISLAAGYGDALNPYAAKTANDVLSGPTSGASAVPGFRALVAADIPALPYGTGTVTSVSVVSANGFAGTSSGGATPALTLTTTITGLLKGNGTAISAATAGTDYLVPSAPVTYTANFSVAVTDVWIINNKSGSSCTATLPAAASYTGRILRFQNYQAQTLISASSNVVPLVGGAAGTAILAGVAGETCTLVSDGSNWLMTQYTPNNCLLLE